MRGHLTAVPVFSLGHWTDRRESSEYTIALHWIHVGRGEGRFGRHPSRLHPHFHQLLEENREINSSRIRLIIHSFVQTHVLACIFLFRRVDPLVESKKAEGASWVGRSDADS